MNSRNLSKEALQHKMEYDRKYATDNVTRKSIYFNKNDPDDIRMVSFLDNKGKRNISGYVKGLIKEDMKQSGE